MALTTDQQLKIKQLGDAYNAAKTQQEKDTFHTQANAIRDAAGLQAGVDYNQVTGAMLPKPQAPQMPDYSGQINSMYDNQKAARLSELRAARDKAVGDVGLQKQETTQAFYDTRNQTDSTALQNAQRLREVMAANGINASGENVTANVAQNAQRLGALNNLNVQERQQQNAFDKRVTDLRDPQNEQALISAIEAERAKALYQAQQDAIRNSMSEAGLTGQYNGNPTLAALQQQFGQNMATQQFDYQKGRDTIGDQRFDKQFVEQQRQFNTKMEQDAMQFAESTGLKWAEMGQREKLAYAQMAYKANKGGSGDETSVDEVYNSLIVSGVPEEQILPYLRQGKASPQAINEMDAYIRAKKAAGVTTTDANEKAKRSGGASYNEIPYDPSWIKGEGFYFPPM